MLQQALLFTAQCAVCMSFSSLCGPHRPCAHSSPPGSNDMVSGKRGLPPGIAGRLSFQTGGSKVARQEEEALVLKVPDGWADGCEARGWRTQFSTHPGEFSV